MRNAKLLSVLLAAVLLCACMIGVMTTGASASDSRVPTATTTYVVGTDADSIRACLEIAEGETWGKDDVLEIQFSGDDSSAFASPNAANGISGWTLFETATIFREDNTQLPIVIRGMDDDRAATIKTGCNSYNATNDYFFVNLTINGGATAKSAVQFYAGSGELVFEETNHNNYSYTYYYGDCQSADAWEGWDADKIAANANEDGLVETGIVFGKGVSGLYASFADDAPDEQQRFSAVGFSYSASNPTIYALSRPKDNVTAALTEEQIEAVKEEAKTATYRKGTFITAEECVMKPWDTAAYLVLDSGTANPTSYEFGYCGARKGVSPVREARLEALSGGYQYLCADSHTSSVNETYVGNSTVIVRGGKTLSSSVGIRLTNLSMLVGNLTLEIHEDDATIPTMTKFVQANQSGATSTIFGNYHFLMTGGTIGVGYSDAKMSGGSQAVNASNEKQWNYSDSNDGYWGAPVATGTIVNEVRGGQIWRFNGARYGHAYENTPVSVVLPGTGETLSVKVGVHNKISGGIIGGPVVQGTKTDSDGDVVDVQTGTKAFYGGVRDSNSSTLRLESVCNDISGGTIYKWNASSSASAQRVPEIYNVISGTKENHATFLCDFYGTNLSNKEVTLYNVIKGYPVFHDGTTKRWIHGGARNGTIGYIYNYLGGMPEFNDFFGGSSGSSSTEGGNAAVNNIENHFAFDYTEKTIPSQIYGGNGEYTDGKNNSNNYITTSLKSYVYSGHFGTFRAESSSGKDRKGVELTIYGGTWSSDFMAANRNTTDSDYKDRVIRTNIYGGTFNATAYMGGGMNKMNRTVENNIYGGTFNGTYYGGGSTFTRKVINNIYGGTFNSNYIGGCKKGNAISIENNIYGGTFITKMVTNSKGELVSSDVPDYMGCYEPWISTASGDAVYMVNASITNNFYGGDFGTGWTYGGHRDGAATTITNNFYSGEKSPLRTDPALNKYLDTEGKSTQTWGTYFYDQFVCGSGYSKALADINYTETITNTFAGGGWTASTGGRTGITIHGGMRYGNVGKVVNNFVEGTYYRFFGGNDYGRVLGTITNNFGKELAEGEEAPALTFTNMIFGGGYESINYGELISAAEEKAEADRTAQEKVYVKLEETYGPGYECGAEAIVNNIYYGTYTQYTGGSYQNGSTNYQSKYDTITNNVYGGTFNKRSDAVAFAGGVYRNAIITTGIINNINGGTFNSNYFGGNVGNGVIECPSIVNNFNGGEGYADDNIQIYLGNGGPDYNGVITSTINDFTANKAYLYCGSYGVHNAPEGAAYAIDTTINGGTFCGVWGQGGTGKSILTGNVRTTVNGGTFNGFSTVDSMRNSIAGGTRNGTTVGNIELIINGGIFDANVVGGTIYGSYSDCNKTITGDITLTINGGDFRENIYSVCRYDDQITCTGTATVTVTQTEGKALKLGGKAIIDSFTANGETVDIAANTNLEIKALTGTLNVNQTEGWQAHDYVKIPAGSALEVTEAVGAYGSYTKDDTILVKGNAVAPAGTTIRLSERLGVRVLLTKEDVDQCGDQFSYEVTLEDAVVAEGTKADLEDYQGYYSFTFDGIGLADFDKEATISGPFFEGTIIFSIAGLAEEAKTAWAEGYPAWADYAEAILELNSVYNKGEANTKTPAAVTTETQASKGEAGVSDAEVTLLMGDAAGLRLTAILDGTISGGKVLVNGIEITDLVKIEETTVPAAEEGGEATVVTTVTAEIYFAHEYLADVFTLEVKSDAGTHMTYSTSIEAIAGKLAIDDKNEQKNNATAFLYYIQKAVACK